MATIGTSVGDWNANNQAKFVNVSGKPFFIPRLNVRQATQRTGTNYNEYRKRQKIYSDLTKNLGLTEFQINDMWNKWQERGNTSSDGFKDFILNQLMLREREIQEEDKKIEELKEIKDAEIISDSNLFPEPPPELNEPPKSAVESNKINYPLYFGVGAGIILVGALIVYKFR
jgi:hypothetical protein